MNISIIKNDVTHNLNIPLNKLVLGIGRVYAVRKNYAKDFLGNNHGANYVHGFNDASIDEQLEYLNAKNVAPKFYGQMNALSKLFVKGELASLENIIPISSLAVNVNTSSYTDSSQLDNSLPSFTSTIQKYFFIVNEGLKFKADVDFDKKILSVIPYISVINGALLESRVISNYSNELSNVPHHGNIPLNLFYEHQGRFDYAHNRLADGMFARFFSKNDTSMLSLDMKYFDGTLENLEEIVGYKLPMYAKPV